MTGSIANQVDLFQVEIQSRLQAELLGADVALLHLHGLALFRTKLRNFSGKLIGDVAPVKNWPATEDLTKLSSWAARAQ